MFRAEIRNEIEKIVPAGTVFSIERSENPEHGDYSSNIALVRQLADGKNPSEVAKDLKAQIVQSSVFNNFIEKIEIAGPGFLNFWIKKEALILALKKPPKPKTGKKLKINLEFVSANPTGPLTMANGRGGFYGDALANILEAVGHKVAREYYINDAGNQIKLLGESILAAEGKIPQKDEYYKGAYIKKLKLCSARLKNLSRKRESNLMSGFRKIKICIKKVS